MTELLQPHAVGRDMARRDGAEKIRGTAVFADETPVEDPLFCRLVTSTVARGHVDGVDATAARALPGVVAVITADDAERHADADDDGKDAELAVLQGREIGFRGQIVAIVLAGTDEVAREAADLVDVAVTAQPVDATLSADRDDLYTPDAVNPDYDSDTAEGDMDAAMAGAPVTVEHTYTTAMQHNNPMEPHATTALWDGRQLTLWDSTQGVHPVRSTIAPLFGLDPEHVRVICPYVGGGFGSKGQPHAHVVAAAMAARALPGRAVKLALTRQQMYSLTGYRTPTIQRVQLAAEADGRLRGIAIDVVEMTSRIKEFAEQTGVPTRTMYAAPNRRTTHRLAALDVPVPSWMRAPGEAPGMFGPEVALDELAAELGIDPVELRVRNEPDVDPETGKPFSSRNLVACLREGAQRFGWAGRDHRPRQRRVSDRDGDWWVGTGVASSVYPTMRMPVSTAAIAYDGGRFTARIGAADLGTGAWTVLPQITADALGVDVADVDVLLGDTDHPEASVAGGSSGTTTWGSALVEAAREFRAKFGERPEDGDEVEADVRSNDAEDDYTMSAYGAQFAEVRVHTATGEVRVARLHGTFAAGRIINPRTARSQFLGGMTMGLGMALHEHSVLDPRTGHVVNHDLAGYHIPANLDVDDLQAFWIDEHDEHVNAMGSKGIGEIGIVGTAAAVANAAWHATGVRVRELPVTLDRFL